MKMYQRQEAAFRANDADASEHPLASLSRDNAIIRTGNIDTCKTNLQEIMDNKTQIHMNSLRSVAAYL